MAQPPGRNFFDPSVSSPSEASHGHISEAEYSTGLSETVAQFWRPSDHDKGQQDLEGGMLPAFNEQSPRLFNNNITPSLPLQLGGIVDSRPSTRPASTIGYASIGSLDELIKQNLMMLLMTSPGERIMDTNFGVGIHRYLFENKVPSLLNEIEIKIREQADLYMPYLDIMEVFFGSVDKKDSGRYRRINFLGSGERHLPHERLGSEMFDNTDNTLLITMKYFVIPLERDSSFEIGLLGPHVM